MSGEEKRFIEANAAAHEDQATALADLIRVRNAHLNSAIRRLIVTLMVFSALVVIVGGANFIQIKEQNRKSTEARQLIIENTNRTKDCTDPNGACYKANQDRLTNAITLLTQYQRIALACATTLPLGLNVDQKIDRIDKCVQEKLKTARPPGGGTDGG